MSHLDAVFGASGPLARSLAGFVPRTVQRRMAHRVAEALENRQTLLVEAGTGTGKTFAYLVPALLSGARVLISTGTRTLQDQLYHRDLPLLAGALGRPARIALLKGRSNYLCRARLAGIGQQAELLHGGADPLPAGASLLAQIRDWSERTRSGDLAELTALPEAHALRAELTSTRDNCTGSRCSEFGRCHVFDARRAALEADIVVVNHHLLLADLALKEDGFGDLLPSVDAFVLDEAHQLPDLAAEFFGVSVSSRQVEGLLQDLRRELAAAGTPRLAEPLAAVVEPALRAAVAELHGEGRRAWREVPAQAKACARALQQALELLAERLDAQAARGPQPTETALAASALRARTFAAALDLILTPPEDVDLDAEADIYADAAPDVDGASDERVGARTAIASPRGFTLSLLPYDVSARFRALTRARPSAWIFTSATLAVGEDFNHFAQRLGVGDAATLQLDSPYDYERQALLFLPPGMPEPSQPQYTDALIERALPLIEAAGGGAFLLFTSHRALRQAAARLRAQTPAWPLLVQGEAPREQLLRHFRAAGNAVLLGAASFWEGVDVQGTALRLVVIDKLPFASPDDPVVRARVDYLNAHGANPFRDYQLPEAVLALKQGVGRLIRSEDDRGVVMIGDPRLTGRGYGRLFLASLPPMPVIRDAVPAMDLLRRCAADAELA
jgi:ATP-dependent DNA helicase DinG